MALLNDCLLFIGSILGIVGAYIFSGVTYFSLFRVIRILIVASLFGVEDIFRSIQSLAHFIFSFVYLISCFISFFSHFI